MMDQLGMGLLISLKDAFSRNAGTIRSSALSLDAGMTSVAHNITRATNQISGGLKMMVGGVGALAFPTAAIASTLDTQKALGELASEGVKDLQSIEDASTRFTNRWAGYNKAEFIGAAYTIKGALNNLSDEAVGTATEMAALTAKATKASIADMTNAFSIGYGIFKNLDKQMSDQDWFAKYSGAFAQTVLQFKTEGAAMSLAMSRLGQSATDFGVPMAEQLAILGQLQTTMPGEQAGTYYRAFLKSVHDGGKELGLQVKDQSGHLLGITQMLQNLKSRFPDMTKVDVRDRISKAFKSDEAMMFVSAMTNGLETLPDNMKKVEQAMANGADTATAMAMAMDSNIWGITTVFRQRVRNLVEQAGNSMAPIVRPMADALNTALGSVQQLITKMPLLTGTVMTAVSGFGLFLIAAGAARFALGGLTYSWVALKIAAISARKSAVESLWSIQLAAQNANRRMGLGLTVPNVNFRQTGAIGGLKQFGKQMDFGQVGSLMFKSADGASRKFLSGLWGGISSVAGRGRGVLSGMMTGIKASPGTILGAVTSLKSAPGALMGGFTSLLGTLARIGPMIVSLFSLSSLASAGFAVAGALVGGLGIVLSVIASIAAAFWPITLTIGVIIASVYVLWNVLKGAFQGFMSVIGPLLSVIGEQLSPVITEIKTAFGELMASFGGAMGEGGLGGALKSIGQVIGWLIGNALGPIIRVIGVGLYVALKTVKVVLNIIEGVIYGLSATFGYLFGKLFDFAKPGVKFVKNIVASIKTWGWEITKAIMACIPGGSWLVKRMFPDAVKNDKPNPTQAAQNYSKSKIVPRLAVAALSLAPVVMPQTLQFANQEQAKPQTLQFANKEENRSSSTARSSFRPIPMIQRSDQAVNASSAASQSTERHDAILDRVDRLVGAVEQQASQPIVVKTAIDGREVATTVANQNRLKTVRNYGNGE